MASTGITVDGLVALTKVLPYVKALEVLQVSSHDLHEHHDKLIAAAVNKDLDLT